jgi:UDP-N-acetylglucosamine--N-acetylmuramyl-(pentapeptide) pyrophosphoryl-undecaprenol N-acetylglucosamine transferase
MHEQNACAGRATRLASRLGVPVASGWDECRGLADGSFTPVGVPVRPLKRLSKRESAAALGLELREEDFVLGVIGGSLGSASLEALVGRLSRETPPVLANAGKGGGGRLAFVVLGDAGPFGPGPNRLGLNGQGPDIHFIGRRWDMTPFYSLCDAVLSRAGASTLAELEAYGVPALTIPWMKAADGHQEANAQNFARQTGNPLWFEDDPDGLDEALRRLVERCAAKKTDAGHFEDTASPALWEISLVGEREKDKVVYRGR